MADDPGGGGSGAHIHSFNVVHNDIKLDNAIVDDKYGSQSFPYSLSYSFFLKLFYAVCCFCFIILA